MCSIELQQIHVRSRTRIMQLVGFLVSRALPTGMEGHLWLVLSRTYSLWAIASQPGFSRELTG